MIEDVACKVSASRDSNLLTPRRLKFLLLPYTIIKHLLHDCDGFGGI